MKNVDLVLDSSTMFDAEAIPLRGEECVVLTDASCAAF